MQPLQPCPCLQRSRCRCERSRVLHDGGNVCEVQVDEARNGDQLGNVLNCLTQNAVSDLECVLEGDLLLGYILQTLVRDDNEGVYILVQLFDAAQRLLKTLLALECERTGNNADRQGAQLTSDLCNNRSCTGAVPPPMPAVINTILVLARAAAI